MNRDVIETQWVHVRDVIRDKFNNLSDEDLRQINGRYDQLIAKLQQKYGYSRDEAEDRIRSLAFDRYATTAPRGARMSANREESSDSLSFFKWILGLGIPLLLALYLLNNYAPTASMPTAGTTTSTMTTQPVVVQTPADLFISNGIRNSLIANPTYGTLFNNLQITTNNGVVTVTGTVPSQESHDFIINTVRAFNGVNGVVDHVIVR